MAADPGPSGDPLISQSPPLRSNSASPQPLFDDLPFSNYTPTVLNHKGETSPKDALQSQPVNHSHLPSSHPSVESQKFSAKTTKLHFTTDLEAQSKTGQGTPSKTAPMSARLEATPNGADDTSRRDNYKVSCGSDLDCEGGRNRALRDADTSSNHGKKFYNGYEDDYGADKEGDDEGSDDDDYDDEDEDDDNDVGREGRRSHETDSGVADSVNDYNEEASGKSAGPCESESDFKDEFQPYPQYDKVVFRWMTQVNCLRNLCLRMISNPWFERASISVILLNCATLGMFQPCDTLCETTQCQVLTGFDHFIFAFFTIEMILKIIAMGFWGKRAYWGETWNRLDFFIVVVGVVELALGNNEINLSAVRTVRVLRPLRAINRIPNLRILVMLLLDTMPMLGNVLVLCFFVFFIFGILGVQLWAGSLRQRCYASETAMMNFSGYTNTSYLYEHRYYDPDDSDGFHDRPFICALDGIPGMLSCGTLRPYFSNGSVCQRSADELVTTGLGLNGISNQTSVSYDAGVLFDDGTDGCVDWSQYYTECRADGPNPFSGAVNFDNVMYAWITIFQVISLEGWSDIMYHIQDAQSFWTWIYFVALIVVGAFFMINLFLVVIATQFAETKRRETEKILSERKNSVSSTTIASTQTTGGDGCYRQIIRYLLHVLRRAHRHGRRFFKAWLYDRRLRKYMKEEGLTYEEVKQLAEDSHFSCQLCVHNMTMPTPHATGIEALIEGIDPCVLVAAATVPVVTPEVSDFGSHSALQRNHSAYTVGSSAGNGNGNATAPPSPNKLPVVNIKCASNISLPGGPCNGGLPISTRTGSGSLLTPVVANGDYSPSESETRFASEIKTLTPQQWLMVPGRSAGRQNAGPNLVPPTLSTRSLGRSPNDNGKSSKAEHGRHTVSAGGSAHLPVDLLVGSHATLNGGDRVPNGKTAVSRFSSGGYLSAMDVLRLPVGANESITQRRSVGTIPKDHATSLANGRTPGGSRQSTASHLDRVHTPEASPSQQVTVVSGYPLLKFLSSDTATAWDSAGMVPPSVEEMQRPAKRSEMHTTTFMEDDQGDMSEHDVCTKCCPECQHTCKESMRRLRAIARREEYVKSRRYKVKAAYARFREKVHRIVSHKYFTTFILLVIVLNTLSMALEHHNQPQELTDIVEYSNYVFIVIFAVEMVMMMISCGLIQYIKSAFNIFDAIIVMMSFVELFLESDSGLSVLRSFRLLRIMRLIRFLPALQRQIQVLLKTMDNVTSFFGLLILFIFIFSVLGMTLFGCKFCDVDAFGNKKSCKRMNFDSLLWALITVFQILTQEDWNTIMYKGMETNGHWSALYFVVLMTFGNYVLFNLLVAILVEGFSADKVTELQDPPSENGNGPSEPEPADTPHKLDGEVQGEDATRGLPLIVTDHEDCGCPKAHSIEGVGDGMVELGHLGSESCLQPPDPLIIPPVITHTDATPKGSPSDDQDKTHQESLAVCQVKDSDCCNDNILQNAVPMSSPAGSINSILSSVSCPRPISLSPHSPTTLSPHVSPCSTPHFRRRGSSAASGSSRFRRSKLRSGSEDERESLLGSATAIDGCSSSNDEDEEDVAGTGLSKKGSLKGVNIMQLANGQNKSILMASRDATHPPSSPCLRARCRRERKTGSAHSLLQRLGSTTSSSSKRSIKSLSSNGRVGDTLIVNCMAGGPGEDCSAAADATKRTNCNQANIHSNSVSNASSISGTSQAHNKLCRQNYPNSGSARQSPVSLTIRPPSEDLSASGQSVSCTCARRGADRNSSASKHLPQSKSAASLLSNHARGSGSLDARPIERRSESCVDMHHLQDVKPMKAEAVDSADLLCTKCCPGWVKPPRFMVRRKDYSLYLLSKENPIRRACTWITTEKLFDNVVLFFIFLNCITLAMERPGVPEDGMERQILVIANYVFTFVFTVEMMLKVFTLGLIIGQDTYLRTYWNVMDCFLVCVALADIILTETADSAPKILGILRVLRLLRALRPLRVISRAPGLKLVVETLLSSLKPIGNIVLICMTFFLIFGILGLQLFKGTFWHCTGGDVDDVKNKTDCLKKGEPFKWENERYNFDDLGQSLMALFVLSSKDGWVSIMYTGLDAVGVDQQPQTNYNEWRLIFFITFILLVGFFVLNMFVGVVVENFHQCREVQDKQLAERREAKLRRKMLRAQSNAGGSKTRRDPSVKRRKPPYHQKYSKARKWIHSIVTHKYFDLVIAAVIFLNVISMALEHYNMPKRMNTVMIYLNYLFTAVFTLEAILKVVALQFTRYIKDRWNQVDCLIVLLSFVGIALESVESDVIPINPTIIRVMRILRIARVLKLLKVAKGIRALLDTVRVALPQVANLGLLFFLLFFIFAALGVELFGRVECSRDHPCDGLGIHANFENFGMAFLTLFRISTGDNWNGMLKDVLRTDCDSEPNCTMNCCVDHVIAPLFFVIFVLTAQFVLVNVVVAVLMKHLEEAHMVAGNKKRMKKERRKQKKADKKRKGSPSAEGDLEGQSGDELETGDSATDGMNGDSYDRSDASDCSSISESESECSSNEYDELTERQKRELSKQRSLPVNFTFG